jgi:CheY-like chemotaxis protein
MNGRPITLLIEGNGEYAKAITQAMTAQRLPQPIHMRTGEEAVSWSSLNECDICVLNFTLRGIDGIETMVRLREWKPDVPVIMMSGVKSEQVVVEAFRAGVRDFVPMTPGYADELAELIVKLAQSLTVDGSPLLHPPPTSRKTAHGPSSYENRLRAIGRQLDLYAYKAINLSEVTGGFLVRAVPRGEHGAVALEFINRDVEHVLSYDASARGAGERPGSPDLLMPTGYEDFLRALGHRLDSNRLQAVTVTELAPLIAVGGLIPIDNSNETTLIPYYELLQAEQIKYLLYDGFRRRRMQRSGNRRNIARITLNLPAER